MTAHRRGESEVLALPAYVGYRRKTRHPELENSIGQSRSSDDVRRATAFDLVLPLRLCLTVLSARLMICAVITHSFRDISKAAWMTAAPVCRLLRAGNAPTSNQLANGSAKQATLPACTQLRQPALRICAFTGCGIRMSAPVTRLTSVIESYGKLIAA